MDLLAIHALKQALQSPGCPICRIGDDTARRYLSSVLHEYVNDPSTRSSGPTLAEPLGRSA